MKLRSSICSPASCFLLPALLTELILLLFLLLFCRSLQQFSALKRVLDMQHQHQFLPEYKLFSVLLLMRNHSFIGYVLIRCSQILPDAPVFRLRMNQGLTFQVNLNVRLLSVHVFITQHHVCYKKPQSQRVLGRPAVSERAPSALPSRPRINQIQMCENLLFPFILLIENDALWFNLLMLEQKRRHF